MSNVDPKLDRLLRSAAQGRDDHSPAAPFGFDTRVVALWRAGGKSSNGLSHLLRRVAILASAVIVIATAAAFREFKTQDNLNEPSANEFAIADSVIQDEFSQ